MNSTLRAGRTLDRAAMDRDALAEAAGDAALVAVLRGKPPHDEVPSAVWWLVAEALRTAVAARRTAAIPAQLGPDEDRSMLLMEAVLLTHAALDELADATGARPVPTLVEPQSDLSSAEALQRSILRLARLLVTQRATQAATLAAALTDHHRALAALRAAPITATFAP